MSICPNCKKRVTNGADQTKQGGIRFHQLCATHHFRSKAKAKRRAERPLSSFPMVRETPALKRLYQTLLERSGLKKLLFELMGLTMGDAKRSGKTFEERKALSITRQKIKAEQRQR